MPRRRDPKYVRDQMKTTPSEPAPAPELSIESTESTESTSEGEITVGQLDDMSKEVKEGIAEFLEQVGIEALPEGDEENEEDEYIDETEDDDESPLEIASAGEDTTPSELEMELNEERAKKAKLTKEAESKTPKVSKTPARELEGHCRVCGKALTREKSVIRGVGPICFAFMAKLHGWNTAQAQHHAKKSGDAEWTALIEKVREALFRAEVDLTTPPEGYVRMSEFCRAAERAGLKTTQAVSACGGDRATHEVLNEVFQPVYVLEGNARRKYLPGASMQSFHLIKEAVAARPLAGAAKLAQDRAEAKARKEAAPVAAIA